MAILLKRLSSILVNTPHGIARIEITNINRVDSNGIGSFVTLHDGVTIESIESADEIIRVQESYLI